MTPASSRRPPRCLHSAGTRPAAQTSPHPMTRLRRRPPSPRSRSSSISAPSTRPPTPAPTSISTPAATGARTIPFRRPGALGPLQRAGRAQQLPALQRAEGGGRRAQDAAGEEVRRLLRRLHEHRLRRQEGRQAAQAGTGRHRRPQDKKELAALQRQAGATYGGGALLRLRRRSRTRRTPRKQIARHRPGRPVAARPRLLPRTPTTAASKIREQYVDAHDEDVHARSATRRSRRRRKRRRACAIETALAKGSMARVDMRDPAKRYHIMTLAELQQLTPGLRLEAVPGRHRHRRRRRP